MSTESFLGEICKTFNDYATDNKILRYKTHHKKLKIPLKYIIFYKFLNSFMLKDRSVELINEYIDYSRSCFHEQEKQISIEYFSDLNDDICKICNKYLSSLFPKTSNNSYEPIIVDGVYSNEKDYKPCLNLGFYDLIKNTPICIDYYGTENRNNEHGSLKQSISENLGYFSNKILVLDRGYFKYEIINFLIERNIKFIIRYKGESGVLNSNLLKNYKNFKIRSIRLNNIVNKDIKIYPKHKKDKTGGVLCKTKIKDDCVLITNLSNHFKNELIFDLYKKRWDIESYFKLVKGNFNFQHLTGKEKTEIQKQYLCINIMCSICKVINHLAINNFKKENKRPISEFLIINCNQSKIIRFIQNIFLKKIFTTDKCEFKIIKKSIEKYVQIRKYEKDRSYPRMCKTPYLKWHLKGYSDKSEITKILRAIINDTVDDLNDNLKSKSKRIEILEQIKL